MKLAIVGSRDFDDYEFLKKIINYHPCTQIISGGARGADTMAKRYAAEQGIPMQEFIPNWDAHGKSAGFLRNEQIVNVCDELVAFCSKIEREQDVRLQKMIDAAERLNKPTYIIEKKEDFEDSLSTI